MNLKLFESLGQTSTSITNLKDLNSEFVSTEACCEEGQCCNEPW